MAMPFHDRYRALVRALEQNHPVAAWRWGDVDLWPLARLALYTDFYWRHAGEWPARPARPWGVTADILRPALNLWRSRHDLAGLQLAPRRADAVLLGDGTSLDFQDGAWQDRFGTPLLTALEAQGFSTLLIQQGDFRRLPRKRKSLMANQVQSQAALRAPFLRGTAELPGHDAVLARLANDNMRAPSLSFAALENLGRNTAALASSFEALLGRVRPRRAFVVGYYAGMGPSFVLACRRRGTIVVDVQRAPLVGAPMAYEWPDSPAPGYSTLPSLFWTWTEAEAFTLRRSGLVAMAAGHAQMAQQGNDAWRGCYVREILVALQPIAGHGADWEAMTRVIDAAPADWRWWIRRHPASDPSQDAGFGRLLAARPHVKVAEALQPLNSLLPHMSVVVSLGSGVAVEAAWHGVPSLFLSPAAAMPFGELISSGMARVVALQDLHDAIATLEEPKRQTPPRPDMAGLLRQLDGMAA